MERRPLSAPGMGSTDMGSSPPQATLALQLLHHLPGRLGFLATQVLVGGLQHRKLLFGMLQLRSELGVAQHVDAKMFAIAHRNVDPLPEEELDSCMVEAFGDGGGLGFCKCRCRFLRSIEVAQYCLLLLGGGSPGGVCSPTPAEGLGA